MDNNTLLDLYHKYRQGTLTPTEQHQWEQLIHNPDQEQDLQTLLEQLWELQDHSPEMSETDAQAKLQYILSQQKLDKPIITPAPSKPAKLWPKIAIAAALTAIISASGIWFYNQNQPAKPAQQTAYQNDVAPGKQGATLTLAGGKKIRLSEAGNGELARQAGVTITKSASGQLIYTIKPSTTTANDLGAINTLSTAKGETYQLRLPDGSLVWLNAASSLTYAANLSQGGTRNVTLEGEGYFEIAKDKSRPFIVTSKDQQVEVLGTHFNINAYSDEPSLNTTLLEGSVKVSTASRSQLIKPGQQAVLKNNTLSIAPANLENITDWKEGDFYLDRVNFKVAMRKIARWYNVTLVYNSDFPEELEAGGWISRENQLSAVLKSIELSGIARFKIEGKTVYISK